MNDSPLLQSSLPSSVPTPRPTPILAVDRTPAWVTRRAWLRRLLIKITGVSISTKIMGIVVILTILFGLVMIIQVRLVMTVALQTQLHNQGFGVASDLADRAAMLLAADDGAGLATLLRDTVDNYPDSRYAFVLDDTRRLLANAARDAEGTVTVGGELAPEILVADLSAPDVENAHIHYDSPEGRVHDFVVPIHDANGTELGVMRLALVETHLNDLITSVTDQMLLTTLLVAGVGILAAMLLTWLLTRPILDLVTTTEQLRQGDLRARAPHWTDDEIGVLADTVNQMIGELEISQQQIVEKENARTHLLSRLISAQEEERKRIARELHDGVGQALTSILVHIKVLAQNEDAATQARMAELRQLVDETLQDVRLLSRELRPSALDDLGLAAALERYVIEFGVRYPTLAVDVHCVLPHRLPPNIETSLYRVIQEAMTNAARHSHATSLSVVINARAGMVHAIIEDNGTGFDVESTRRAGGSVGLHSMNERSELLNGTLEIESSADGTTVYVEIPIVEIPSGETPLVETPINL